MYGGYISGGFNVRGVYFRGGGGNFPGGLFPRTLLYINK